MLASVLLLADVVSSKIREYKTCVKVTSLYVYPLKGTSGISVKEWPLGPYGLLYDRYWVISTRDGKKMSQRELPKMVLITTRIDEEELGSGKGELVLNYPDMPELRVPITPPPGLPHLTVNMWGEDLSSFDLGDEAGQWLSKALGIDLRLCVKDPNHARLVEDDVPPPVLAMKSETAFADGFPILLISSESLQDVNAHVQNPVGELNFRANVYVTGCRKPYEEETWKKIELESLVAGSRVPIYVCCRCQRCQVPTINPATGEKAADGQPQKWLQEARRVDKGPQSKYYGNMGMNCCPGVLNSTLRVGDTVRVLETGFHQRN